MPNLVSPPFNFRAVYKSFANYLITNDYFRLSRYLNIKTNRDYTVRARLGKGVCRCMSAEHGDNELELGPDDILADGLLKKGIKDQSQLEVAIGDGMEFTIHGDLKGKKGKTLMNNVKSTLMKFIDESELIVCFLYGLG